jgi:hypothetical protein
VLLKLGSRSKLVATSVAFDSLVETVVPQVLIKITVCYLGAASVGTVNFSVHAFGVYMPDKV